MRTKMKADYFKIYPPTENNEYWEIGFYNNLAKDIIIITLEDFTKFRETVEETKKRTT